ncbi:MAG: thioredoxin [Flavobacteriales bacterium]
MALELTDANFKETINTDKPVLVDFWAAWCGPCRVIGPIIEELASEYDGKAVVGKLDVDNNPNISIEYGIRNIPAVLVFKNGVEVKRIIGANPKPAYKNALDEQLA